MIADSEQFKKKTDAEIWQSVVREDRAAYAYLFDKYSSILFKYGLTLVRDEELIKDSLQDFFIYLWDRKANLNEIRHLQSYLFTAFRRYVFQKAKSMAKEEKLQDALMRRFSDETASSETRAIEAEQAQWEKRLLSEGIEKLPARLQEIVFLKFYQGMSYEEISSITSLNYQVVRNMVYKALKKLRSIIPAKPV